MPPPISSSAHKLFTTEEIVDQPAGFLREIIRALCADDAVRTRTSILLSQLQNGGQEQLEFYGDSNLTRQSNTASTTPISTTNPLPRDVKVCTQCKKEFVPHETVDIFNRLHECQFHDGHLYICSEYWEDWDPNDGPIDTPFNRKHNPKGFRWSCCDSTLDENDGCQTDLHVYNVGAMRKETHRREKADEEVPPCKRLKLRDETDMTHDAITGASGAAILTGPPQASTLGVQQTRPGPKTLPEGKKICVKCKEEYWEDKNWPRSCWFHDGYLDLNPLHEVWKNMDYDDESEIDTEEMREEVPEGFLYECCGETGLSKGCKWGTHSSSKDLPVPSKQLVEVNDLSKSNLEYSGHQSRRTGAADVENEEEAQKTRLDDKVYAWLNH
ncbi:hypothetical protein V8F20_007995 [Naviculisporaceae sp. PSN 640]